MQKILPSGRIQHKTISKIAIIGLAAATMMITVSMIGAIQLEEASAARKAPKFCYSSSGVVVEHCFSNMKDCRDSQSLNPLAISSCSQSKQN